MKYLVKDLVKQVGIVVAVAVAVTLALAVVEQREQ